MESKTELFLRDAFTDKQHKVTVEITDGAVFIWPEGYGEYSAPIAFEFAEGKPRIIVWGDKKRTNDFEIIEIEDAKVLEANK